MTMTLWRFSLLCGVLLTVLATAARAEDKADDFLTKDGMLKEALMIKDVQGGFAGFTGKAWTIQPNGEWTLANVFNEKLTVDQKGTLTKEQLATLAEELAKYNLSSLETKSEGKAMANPHNVLIKWGKREVTLTLGAGEALPKPDKSAVPGRYAGIAAAVADLCKAKK
jgi:hypothetical protein